MLFLSTGPGALTALGALQEAYATGVPLVVITSQVPRAGPGAAPRHAAPARRSTAQRLQCHQKHRVAEHSAQLPSLLADAWSLAQSAPAGPTWVEIPQDVLLEPTDTPAASTLGGHRRRGSSPAGRARRRRRRAAERCATSGDPGRRRSPPVERRAPRRSSPSRNCLTRRWFRRSAAKAQSRSTTRCRRPRGSRTATPPRCWRTPTCCWQSARPSAR